MRINHKCWQIGISPRVIGNRQLLLRPITLKEVVDECLEHQLDSPNLSHHYIFSVSDDYIIDNIISIDEALRILKLEQL